MATVERMAGQRIDGSTSPANKEQKERAEVNQYWENKGSNPQTAPPDVDDSFTPSQTLSNPVHSGASASSAASDYVLGNQSSASGHGTESGKSWAKNWDEGWRNDMEGIERAQNYINQAKAEQVVDREALQKTIDQRPMKHFADSTIQQSNWGGDMWKNKAPEFKMPDNLKPIEKPDLSGDKWLDEIKDF